MHLAEGRLHDLVTQAREDESFIVCHDTLPDYRFPEVKPAICRGFADRYSTQALQVIERLFGFIEVNPPHQPGSRVGTPEAVEPRSTNEVGPRRTENEVGWAVAAQPTSSE
ncbi:hypothetical protein [Salinispora pacifica]|uniref:hypothetical protein n=1 Tax=Salinispora pacifica TaxID=351187 RepID=UPI0004B278BA|nr:hypothetical protein [Salinispora pacifica]